MEMKLWFSIQVLREELDASVYNYLISKSAKYSHFSGTSHEYKRITKKTGVEVIDHEGVEPCSFFEKTKTKRFVSVMSYLFSNGYCLDHEGKLKKQYKPMKEISEETPLEELIRNNSTLKWLKKSGYVQVKDILELNYIALLQAGNSSRLVNGPNDIDRWYDIASKLAGHGYVFDYDFKGNFGRIRKGQANLYPKIEFESKTATPEAKCAESIDWGRYGLPGPLTPEQLSDKKVASLIANIDDLLIRTGELIQQLIRENETLTNNQQIIEKQQAIIEAIEQLLEAVKGISPGKDAGHNR